MLVLSVHISEIARANDFKGLFDLLEVRGWSSSDHDLLHSLQMPLCLTFDAPVPTLPDSGLWRLSPHLIDLPWDVSNEIIASFRSFFPSAVLQGSIHGCIADSDLPHILKGILEKGFDAVKIARMSTGAKDTMALLSFLKQYGRKTHLTCVPMGEEGQFGRILAMTMGSYLSYCCLPGSPTAPGQLDIASMHAVYGAASLSEKTSRFALLGHPVRQSPSHRTHSKLLRNFGIDGLYVKIPVQQEEASEILPLLKALGFSGASVTTPLKQDLGSCLLPINTIKWTAGEVQTKNTDAPSLVEALAVRFPLKGARVLILGAGAVGISAARSLTDAGSTVAMYNRTFSKASRVASLYGAIAIDETELLRPTQAYDVVVNATSAHASATFPSVFSLLPLREWGTQVVAEFAISSKTPFLLLAEQQGMRSISGQELWARQAAKQFQWWCGINELLAFQFLQEELACR